MHTIHVGAIWRDASHGTDYTLWSVSWVCAFPEPDELIVHAAPSRVNQLGDMDNNTQFGVGDTVVATAVHLHSTAVQTALRLVLLRSTAVCTCFVIADMQRLRFIR